MAKKKGKNELVSIILPCVGQGIDLKLPYSKELVMVDENSSAIDLSFRHILKSKTSLCVVVIVDAEAHDLINYLTKKYSNKVKLMFEFQKAHTKGIAHTLKLAKHVLGEKNIIFLPNTIIVYKDKNISLIDKIAQSLQQQPFSFIYKNEDSVTRLKSGNALLIQNEKVIDYANRPQKLVEGFNALGVTFGFKKEIADKVISVIKQSLQKKVNFKKIFQKSVLYKSVPVEVDECINISTWTQLNAYLLRQYLIKSGIDPQFLAIKD